MGGKMVEIEESIVRSNILKARNSHQKFSGVQIIPKNGVMKII